MLVPQQGEVAIAVGPGRVVRIAAPDGATYGWLLSQLMRVSSDGADWVGLRNSEDMLVDLGEAVDARKIGPGALFASVPAALVAVETGSASTLAAAAPAARERAAAAVVTRCIQRAGARHTMAVVVQQLRKRLSAMCELLRQGFEVTKFSRGGAPSKRVLWMAGDGALVLSKSRRAKREKTIRLEDISSVVRGVGADNFAKSPKFAAELAGMESCCISISGSASDASFHFRLGNTTADSTRSTTAAKMLVELLQALVRQLSVGTAADMRAKAEAYAQTGRLTVSVSS
jgi:hypothetical protein